MQEVNNQLLEQDDKAIKQNMRNMLKGILPSDSPGVTPLRLHHVGIFITLFLISVSTFMSQVGIIHNGYVKSSNTLITVGNKSYTRPNDTISPEDKFHMRKLVMLDNGIWNKFPTDRKMLSYDTILGQKLAEEKKMATTTAPPPPKAMTDTVDCQSLMNGNKYEMDWAQKKMKQIKHQPLTEEDYIKMTGNCDSFRKSRGYLMENSEYIRPVEKAFPLAFSIRMHKSIEQAERLLRAIYRPHNIYCIHIDTKSPAILHTTMGRIASCLPNVKLASRMVNLVYRTFAQTEADLICMKDLLESAVPWKYYLNLAGTEYPLKTNLEIVTILKYLNGTNDIEQYAYPPTFNYRHDTRWIVQNNTLISAGHHLPFRSANLKFMKGCSYNSFSRPFVEWVLTADLPRAFIEWTKETRAPDEIIWGTLNNHPDAPGGYPVSVAQTSKTFLSREVIWIFSAAHCSSTFIHDICILSIRELPWLSRRWEMFANKFDLEIDHISYMCLEQTLSERVRGSQLDSAINWHALDRAPHVYFTRVLHRNITLAIEKYLVE